MLVNPDDRAHTKIDPDEYHDLHDFEEYTQ